MIDDIVALLTKIRKDTINHCKFTIYQCQCREEKNLNH